MKQILIPTDFSNNSIKAIEYAINLYGQDEVKYTLLNTFDIANNKARLSSSRLKKEMEDQAEADLKKLKLDLASKFPKAQIKLRDEYGDLIDILSNLSERDYDLVVMGTKGASGLKEVFLGSNSWDAIENASLPTIVVPNDANQTIVKNIVLAVDDQVYSSKDNFKILIDLASKDLVKLTILRVGENEKLSQDQLKQISNWFENIEVDFAWMKASDIPKGIQSFVNSSECDLLAVVNRKKSFWESLFHSSITKKLTFHSDIPILALKD